MVRTGSQLCFCRYQAPMVAKMTWVSARSTTVSGKPPSRKPSVVPSATAAAIMGEMNIAIKTGTWLARVKEAGSIMILMGENIGITMPMAISMPASAS